MKFFISQKLARNAQANRWQLAIVGKILCYSPQVSLEFCWLPQVFHVTPQNLWVILCVINVFGANISNTLYIYMYKEACSTTLSVYEALLTVVISCRWNCSLFWISFSHARSWFLVQKDVSISYVTAGMLRIQEQPLPFLLGRHTSVYDSGNRKYHYCISLITLHPWSIAPSSRPLDNCKPFS